MIDFIKKALHIDTRIPNYEKFIIRPMRQIYSDIDGCPYVVPADTLYKTVFFSITLKV